ncbi:Oncosphere antigen B [Taenia solium]|eukprot:TsM_000833000 transcript=TsM_000833000 gene=TsM_000833000
MQTGYVTELPKHFRWNRVGSRSVELGWDVDALSKLGADEIKLRANYYPAPNRVTYKYETVPFSYGKLTLDGLNASTLYEMDMKGLKNNKPVWNHTAYLITPAKGKIAGAIIT